MCGLAGFTNVRPHLRGTLARALGLGVDTRGGHAAGYVAVSSSGVHYGRKIGTWALAAPEFVAEGPAHGDMAIIHARYATCGKRDSVEQAHPFAPARAGRTVLWGAHNGMIEGTHESAEAHGRTHDVDSRELFELLADGDLDGIRQLAGYGTLAWIREDTRDRVCLVRMTEDAALEVALTECGALVWASTLTILHAAIGTAGMRVRHTYRIEVGKVVEAHADGSLSYSAHGDITLQDRYAAWLALDTGDPLDDDRDAGPCPSCGNEDTWAFLDEGHCAACGYDFPLDVAADDWDADDPANDDATWDSAAFDRWIETERRHARLGRTGGVSK